MTESKPELVEKVEERADEVSKKVEELGYFRESIEDYEESVNEMEDDEREAFYESASQVRDRAADADSPEELLELEEDIREAVRSPLKQVVEGSLEEFLALVQPELTEEDREHNIEQVKSKQPEKLTEAADTYQELCETVEGMSETPRNVLRSVIEEKPVVLQTPEQSLEQTTDNIESWYETLEELESLFNDRGDWAPEFSFTEVEDFYTDELDDLDVSGVEYNLNEISSSIDGIDEGVGVEELIRSELESWYETEEMSELLSKLKDIENDVSSATEKYREISNKINEIGGYDSSGGVFEEEIDDLQTSYNQLELQEYSSLDDLTSKLEGLDEQVDDFVGQLHGRLKAQQDMAEELDVPEEPPEVNVFKEGQPPIKMFVENDLSQALEDCGELSDWVIDHLESGTWDIDREQMIDVWDSLTTDGSIEITDENRECILALSNSLSLKVVLRDG